MKAGLWVIMVGQCRCKAGNNRATLGVTADDGRCFQGKGQGYRGDLFTFSSIFAINLKLL